jgi:hypothetical protein
MILDLFPEPFEAIDLWPRNAPEACGKALMFLHQISKQRTRQPRRHDALGFQNLVKGAPVVVEKLR